MKSDLLGRTGLLRVNSQGCASMPKTSKRSTLQNPSLDREELMRSHPSLRRYQQLMAAGGWRAGFLQGCGPWEDTQAPGYGPATHAHPGNTKWTQWV